MSTKELAIASIMGLPDGATWTDIEEQIRFQAAVEKGLNEIKNGEVVAHDDVKAALKEWISG